MDCKHQEYDEEDQEWYSTLSMVFVDDRHWHECSKCGLTLLPEALEPHYTTEENE